MICKLPQMKACKESTSIWVARLEELTELAEPAEVLDRANFLHQKNILPSAIDNVEYPFGDNKTSRR